MEERTSGCAGKGVFEAVVVSNRQIGDTFWKVVLEFSGEGAEAFGGFQPGQFVQLDASEAQLPPADKIPEELADAAQRDILLRRPFSFTDVTRHGNKVAAELLYCVVGPATLRMTTLKTRSKVSIVGPLGNGFSPPEGKKLVLLVFGGMGTAPIQHVGKALMTGEKKNDIQIVAFAGAKTRRGLPFEKLTDEISEQLGFSIREFARFGMESMIATDDGSAGYHGLVTDCFTEWLKDNKIDASSTIIYSCGPEPMLSAVAKIAKERGIACEVSMERRMACGMGLCQSCAIECRVEGSDETVYKMCCEDGPIFDAQEVVFGH
ncbi:MAG: dihydroorotate dehydrogenase electron transfer subunit [Sedimentisphaerales bacterium]|nr:dihydroorotate dehydrogenase electron transfer subunit [Sedimentisphaerales bacterium]